MDLEKHVDADCSLMLFHFNRDLLVSKFLRFGLPYRR